MDVLRRNTDYGLRAMIYLSMRYGKKPVSARELSRAGNYPYQLGCKLMQRLHKAGLVKSCMGPKGGFQLSRAPGKITLFEIIKVLQGGIRLNRCHVGGVGCECAPECVISVKLGSLQRYIDDYFGGITLEGMLESPSSHKATRTA